MPLIAITACQKLEDYRQSILHVGGEVRIVEASEAKATGVLEGAQGLLLTGGSDVAPERYGESRHATVVDVDAARDAFEIGLLSEARTRDLPVFAICRGIQVLNVARGGSLVQDIPTQVAGALAHSLKVPPNQAFTLAHEIWIEKESLLSTLMGDRLGGADTCDVNSRHHQAIKHVAEGLRVVATAPDGVIEAIEDPAARFLLGVQWHPENFWRTGEFRALFEGFVEAAGRT